MNLFPLLFFYCHLKGIFWEVTIGWDLEVQGRILIRGLL